MISADLEQRLNSLLQSETAQPGGKVIKMHPNTFHEIRDHYQEKRLAEELRDFGKDPFAAMPIRPMGFPPIDSIPVMPDETLPEGELLLVETIWRWY